VDRSSFITGGKIERTPSDQTVRERIEEEYDGEELLFADGFDDAIVGIQAMTAGHNACVVYDYDKCVEILIERDEMDMEEAIEHMEFNVTGGYVGEATPSFIHIIST
jgi:hypothetical protein